MREVNMDGLYEYKPRKNLSKSKYAVYPTTTFLKPNAMEDMFIDKVQESCKNRQNLVSPEFSKSSKQEETNQESKINEQNMAEASVIKDQKKINQIMTEDPSSSSYILACDQSILSAQMDDWLSGNANLTKSAGIQFSRVPVFQSSSLEASSSFDPGGVPYLLTLLVPLCSMNSYLQWACSTNNIINATELILVQLKRYCNQIRIQIRRIAEDHLARDLFATLMQIVLVLYAMGFLVVYLYQTVVVVPTN